MDERGRLHSEDAPAIVFKDGYEVYAWHGINVPEWIIKEPQRITTDVIERAANAEVRRVMIERYGSSRYLLDAGARVLHEDEFGVLYRKELQPLLFDPERPRWDDEPLVMVKVKNATIEADGTYREYFLRVPPHMSTARQAVAWTFHMDENDYLPARES